MLPRCSALAVVAGVLVVSGCGGGHTTSDHGQRGSPDPAHGAAHDASAAPAAPEVSTPPESADWNAADATYLTQMVAHHSQALDMAELVDERAADPRVRRLARSIDAGQGREVIVMATWLVDHGQPEPTLESVAAVHHAGMPGMLTPEQLDALAAAEGAAFDRRFLEGMVQHHQGAVAMAEEVLGHGEDQRVEEMATDVIATQNAEIAVMRDLLAELP